MARLNNCVPRLWQRSKSPTPAGGTWGWFSHTTTLETTPVCHHPHGACGTLPNADTATSTPNQYGVNRPCIRRRSESASSINVPITHEDPPGWTGTTAKVLDGCRLALSAELVSEDCPAPELHDCGPQQIHFFRLVSGHGGAGSTGTAAALLRSSTLCSPSFNSASNLTTAS